MQRKRILSQKRPAAGGETRERDSFLFITNLTVEILNGIYLALSVSLNIADTACSSLGSSYRGHVRNLCLNSSFSQIAVIMDAVLANRRVDNCLLYTSPSPRDS